MASQELLPDAEHIFECSICLERFTFQNPPKTLPCGHVLCLQCLQRVLEDERRCPECRAQIDKPRHVKAESFANNIQLLQLIDMLKSSPAKPDCSVCCRKSGTNKCSTCKAQICSNCEKYHKDQHQLQNIYTKFKQSIPSLTERIQTKESEIRDRIKRDVVEIISAVYKVEEALYSELHEAVTRTGEFSEQQQLFVTSVDHMSGVPTQNELTEYITNGMQLDKIHGVVELNYESNKNKDISAITIGCIKIKGVDQENEGMEQVRRQVESAVTLNDDGIRAAPIEEQGAVASHSDGVSQDTIEKQRAVASQDDRVSQDSIKQQGAAASNVTRKPNSKSKKPKDPLFQRMSTRDKVQCLLQYLVVYRPDLAQQYSAQVLEENWQNYFSGRSLIQEMWTKCKEMIRLQQTPPYHTAPVAERPTTRFFAEGYNVMWFGDKPWDVSFLPGGELLVTGRDGSLTCMRRGSSNRYSWDNIVWQIEEPRDHRLRVSYLPSIATGQSCIWVGDANKNRVLQLSHGGDYQTEIYLKGSPQGLTASSMGVYVLILNNDHSHSYSIAEIAGNRVVAYFPLPYDVPADGHQAPRDISYGGKLAVCDCANEKVYIFQMTNDGLILVHALGQEGNVKNPVCATWDPMDGSLIVVEEDGAVTVYDSRSWAVKQHWEGQGARCGGVSISPDGHLAVCKRLYGSELYIYPPAPYGCM